MRFDHYINPSQSLAMPSRLLSPRSANRLLPWQRFALTLAACAATTLIALPLPGHLDAANIVMLFLLTVLLVAVFLGLRPALLAAFVSVGLFDFFFVPPRFTFVVNDGQYLVTFAVMLAVAIFAGKLAADLRSQADASAAEASRTRALYEMARDLTGALMLEQVSEITNRFLHHVLGAEAILLLPDNVGQLHPCAECKTSFAIEPRLAIMAFSRSEVVKCDTLADNVATLYLPLKAPMRIRGVIAVSAGQDGPQELLTQRERLETMASLVAIAVERVHYVDVAQRTQVEIVSERLRSSVLSAISHDLRTPLTALVGLADSLAESRALRGTADRETAASIREQARRLAGLVGNLLDMARLHAGSVTLNREWQPIEEVIGSSIKLLGSALAGHPVQVLRAADLPLVAFDAVLIERVFCNLLENAAKYSPATAPIEISARACGGQLEVCIADHGPGFSAPVATDTTGAGNVFAMFVRGEAESAKPGVGLGLAICRAIIEAHDGTIRASNREEGGKTGACVTFTLPLGNPPTIEEEPIEAGSIEEMSVSPLSGDAT